jgi:nucleotide-binding universal stress UspA family protein
MNKIVVGVDSSKGSRAALRWAYREASIRSCELEVVTVWQFPITTTLPAFGAMPTPEDLGGEAERALVSTIAEEGIVATGEAPVTILVAEGAAAAALLDAAKDADLLVVGSRGHGGFAGLLLGSVSQQCATHAPCPVVVVPAD